MIALLADACSITPLKKYACVSESHGSRCLLASCFPNLRHSPEEVAQVQALDCSEPQAFVNF